MTCVMLPGQHAWLRAPQAHTHCSRDHSIRHDHLRVRHRLGSGTEGWGEKRRHLYWVLAAPSLLKVVFKTLNYTDISCTLLNGAAFYKQLKNVKILSALFSVSLSLPTGWGHWQLEVAIPSPAFLAPSRTSLLPWHCNWGSAHSLIPTGSGFEELALA